MEHPTQRLIEEYYSAKKIQMERQLVYFFRQGEKDVSDILRGKIQMLDEILGMKAALAKINEIEQIIKNEEEKQKGAK